jgi:membrane protein implicated in regulation of membrane protease activity
MNMEPWMIWIVLAVVLAAGELMWPSLLLAPFAAGALLGAISQSAGLGTVVSLVVFLTSSGLLLSFTRPIAQRHLHTPPASRTGTAALVGKVATVTVRVDRAGGAVKLDGELWTARPYDDDEVIQPGRRVHVIEINGATALVSDIY